MSASGPVLCENAWAVLHQADARIVDVHVSPSHRNGVSKRAIDAPQASSLELTCIDSVIQTGVDGCDRRIIS